jgi:Ca-activated chloride channel homolog
MSRISLTFSKAALLGAAVFAASPLLQSAQAKGGRDAVLILDASGSMWGQLGSDTKMALAKKALDGIVDRWPDDGGLGLMAYGHRSKGDCNDIEMLAPLGALDKTNLKTMIGRLQPRGKTPLSASLMQAANAVKGNEDGATVILVSDGIESCNADPCAVAAELKKADVELVAHVIGFDVADPAAKAQLACIASNTGGVYLDAKDASGLETALNKASEAAQGKKVKTEAPKKPKKDPLAEFNVQGTVRLSEDGDPLTGQGPAWLVYEVGSDAEGKGNLIAEKVVYDARFLQKLAPGDYMLEVNFGDARKIMPITVKADEPLKVDISLEAGFVTSTASAEGGGDLSGVTWEIRRKPANPGEAGERLSTKYDPVPRFIIPAGDYDLALIKDNATALKPFTLAAGDSVNLDMSLNIGRVIVKALYAPGGSEVTSGISFAIHKPPSIEGGDGEMIDTKYDAQSNFGLPAGKYRLKAAAGQASASMDVEVKTGEATTIEIVLNAGVLGWGGAANESIAIFDAKKDLNGERKWIDTKYDDEGNLALNAGDYVLVADFGGDVKKEFAFTIKPGERTEIVIAR